jgi:ATP synthase protein I
MNKPPNRMKRYLRFSSVGLEMGLSVLVGLFIGQQLDTYFGTEPWLLLLFLLFGMIAGFRSLYRLLKALGRNERNERNDKPSEP